MENIVEKKQNKIYAIYSQSTGECYIGSTSAYIWNRLLTHRAHYYQYQRRMNNTRQYDFNLQIYSSFKILMEEDHQIMLLELIPVDTDKIAISARERWHINNPPTGYKCINWRCPGGLKDKDFRNETTICSCGITVKNSYKKYHQKFHCKTSLLAKG
jgi:hypothetical protein